MIIPLIIMEYIEETMSQNITPMVLYIHVFHLVHLMIYLLEII